jgi:hypothetical protein
MEIEITGFPESPFLVGRDESNNVPFRGSLK